MGFLPRREDSLTIVVQKSTVVVSTILTNYLPSFQNQDILISQF